ncbi:MAG: DUF1273 family protein [Nodosilinea sp. WJT8-NPBG4]|jgi:uncharacterized phage-like protein YoqJ|nr:DUF1273 family protein [Nodosilinea sp. WJT8-NPBG4]
MIHLTSLGFTGHRRQRLIKHSANIDNRLVDLMTAVIQLEIELIGCDLNIVSGMALGLDIAAAKVAKLLGLPLIAMVPFEGQESVWNKSDKDIYFNLLSYATEVNYCSPPPYSAWKFQHRNKAIVDNSNKMIALWDGVEDGGTYNCIKYAEATGKPVVNVWNRFVKYV